MFPAAALATAVFNRCRLAGDEGLIVQSDGTVFGRQPETHLKILDRIGRGQRQPFENKPGKRHARSKQQGAPAKPHQATRAHQIFDHHGKVGNAHERRGIGMGDEQVGSLHRLTERNGESSKAGRAAGRQRTIGIHHQHSLRRIGAQYLPSEGQRIALATALHVEPFGGLRTGGTGQSGGIVCAIVGYHKDRGCRRHFAQGLHGLGDIRGLIISRYKDSAGWRRCAFDQSAGFQRGQAKQQFQREIAEKHAKRCRE